jgi:hypothetical protein
MTMHEVLINNGFTHIGPCTICTAGAEQYSKRVNNKEVLVKVANSQRKFVLYYNGEDWRGQYRQDIAIETVLQNVITNNKL